MTTVTLAAPVPASPISAPSIAYGAILPILIILGAACLGVLVEAVLKARQRYAAQVTLSVVAILAAGVVTVVQGTGGNYAVTLAGALSIDQATYAMWGVLLALALASVLLMADRIGPVVYASSIAVYGIMLAGWSSGSSRSTPTA